jgi:hypothetical protein
VRDSGVRVRDLGFKGLVGCRVQGTDLACLGVDTKFGGGKVLARGGTLQQLRDGSGGGSAHARRRVPHCAPAKIRVSGCWGLGC